MATSTELAVRARWLAWATIVWNVVEGVVAVGSGIAAGSIALVGFGLDSFVEVFAAVVVLWRLVDADKDREQRALRLIGISFFLLAAYAVAESARDLLGSHEPKASTVGIVLAVVSLIVMPVLAAAKRRTGRAMNDAVVVADAGETRLCAYLSVVLVVGLALNALLGWWWADPLAGLVVAALAVREGREAFRGEACDDCC